MNATSNNAVLLSPHIDDVALSLGGALLDGRFPSATVVNVFSTSRSAYDDNDVERVTATRRREDRSFFQKMQWPMRSIYLDRLDAPLRLEISDDEVCSVSSPASDAHEVVHILKAIEPLRAPHALLIAPLGLGRHVDHVLVHRAACDSTTMGWRLAFYEDAPYANDLTFEEIQLTANAASKELGGSLSPLLLPFDQAGLDKVAAITVYRSQLGPTSVARVHSHSMRFGDPAERLWILEPSSFQSA